MSFTLARDAGSIAMTGSFQSGEGVGRITFTPNSSSDQTLRGEMQALGYRESLSQYTAFRIHGVNLAFIRDIRDFGLKDLSADQLVAMRIHGVSTQFIRELKDAGYQNVPVEKLIEMRIHGIDADFLSKAQ